MSILNQLQNSTRPSAKMPVLFLGHGSPMNAIDDNMFVQGFKQVATQIPVPQAILCISAHWFTSGTYVTSGTTQNTIHDFHGFPPQLYKVQYPAPGQPNLAAETTRLLQPAAITETDAWGLDHGAWSVLVHMYPQANIPVIQLSIDGTKPAAYHFNLARQLQALRHKGVLIVGSGNIIHNLSLVNWRTINTPGAGHDWALEAHSIFNRLISEGNFAPLINYHAQGSAVNLAIPTPDHYLPLIYTLALHDKADETLLFNNEVIGGSLSMTSVLLRPSHLAA